MAAEYRKKLISETWHFCSNCSHWPTEGFISCEELPRREMICNECVVKNQHGECE